MSQKYYLHREESERFRAFLRERRMPILADFYRLCKNRMRMSCPSYSWFRALYAGRVGFTFQFYLFMVEHWAFEQNLKPENRLSWRDTIPEAVPLDPVTKERQVMLGFRETRELERRGAS